MKNDRLKSSSLKVSKKICPTLEFLNIFKITTLQRRWCNKWLSQKSLIRIFTWKIFHNKLMQTYNKTREMICILKISSATARIKSVMCNSSMILNDCCVVISNRNLKGKPAYHLLLFLSIEIREVQHEDAFTNVWQNPNDNDYDERHAFQDIAKI